MQHTPGNCCSDKKGKYRKNVGRRKGKEENLPIWDVYETTGNETLQDISESFGVSVQTLIQANTHLGKLSSDSVFELHSELWIRPQEENISLQKEPSMTWMNQSRNNNHNTNVNSSVSRTSEVFVPEDYLFIESHRVKDLDQSWKKADIYKHPNQENMKKGRVRIIMSFPADEELEGWAGDDAYTMTSASILYDPDGEHILSSVILASRKSAYRKKMNYNIVLNENIHEKKKKDENAKKRKVNVSNNESPKKKKKSKKKKKKPKKKRPSLLSEFKSAFTEDSNIFTRLEKVADNLQSQVNTLRDKVKKYKADRHTAFLNVFQKLEERMEAMNNQLDTFVDEEE